MIYALLAGLSKNETKLENPTSLLNSFKIMWMVIDSCFYFGSKLEEIKKI